MIEAHVDVKTTDGYLLRLFCVGFTKKRNNQIRKTSYAQHQQVRPIRKKMVEIMTREVQTNDLKEVVNKLYVEFCLLIFRDECCLKMELSYISRLNKYQ